MHADLAKILDLEYFLLMDTDLETTGLTKRDRALFLELQQEDLPSSMTQTPPARRKALFAWLAKRKKQVESDRAPVFPGQMIMGTLRTLILYISIIGFFAGGSMAFALLAYTGKAPINIFNYLLVLIIPQILLVLGLISFLCFKKSAHSHINHSPILLFLSKTIIRLAKRMGSRFLNSLAPADKNAFLATLGSVSSSNQTHGHLFFWPLFSMPQCFGVMFNLGALGATLIKVMGSDLAFGWQSTLQVSTQAAYNFVAAIALPWSWIVPADLAHPTLGQIGGSKMVLKEGIYHLATPDLVSWWPFLCFALICYGLLPRIFLAIVARYAANKVIREHPLSSPDIDRLLFRMTTPLVETTPRDFRVLEKTQAPGLLPPQPSPAAAPQPKDPDGEGLVVLIPEEIAEQCPFEHLYRALHIGTGTNPSRHLLLDPYDQETVLNQLKEMAWQENRPRVTILQEAWQPPIRELLNFVTTLATFFDHPAMITIALIGKPTPETILTSPDDVNAQVWKDQVARLANPAIEIIKLGTAHDQ